MNYATKPLDQYTFAELVALNQSNVILSIPTGGINQAVFDAMSMALMWKNAKDVAKRREDNTPKCSCCGTTENLHRDLGSGGPYRCNSADCVMF